MVDVIATVLWEVVAMCIYAFMFIFDATIYCYLSLSHRRRMAICSKKLPSNQKSCSKLYVTLFW